MNLGGMLTKEPNADDHAQALDPVTAAVNELIARSSDKAFRSGVSRGVRPQTEHYAFPHLNRHLNVLPPRNRAGAYRALGLIASNVKLQHDPKASLGQSLARLNHAATGDWPSAKPSSISERVMILPDVSMETAAEILGSLISHAASKNVAVNFYNLAKTLTFWELSDNERARAHRAQIINDYYNH